jgi:hypothetical protein
MYGIHNPGFIDRGDELIKLQQIKEKNFSVNGKKVKCFSLDTLAQHLESSRT